MNKQDVVTAVCERTGVPMETVEKVLKALESVLQDELGSQAGLSTINKVANFIQFLTGKS